MQLQRGWSCLATVHLLRNSGNNVGAADPKPALGRFNRPSPRVRELAVEPRLRERMAFSRQAPGAIDSRSPFTFPRPVIRLLQSLGINRLPQVLTSGGGGWGGHLISRLTRGVFAQDASARILSRADI